MLMNAWKINSFKTNLPSQEIEKSQKDCMFIILWYLWKKAWHLTPVFFPGESWQGFWQATVHRVAESDMIEVT